MSSRVEHLPNVVLWLKVRGPRAARCGPLDGGHQIVYPNVEVLRGGLTAGFGGPERNRPMLLKLEVEQVLSPDLGPARVPQLPWGGRAAGPRTF